MSKSEHPVTDWMHKRDLPGVLKIEDSNLAYDGWGEAKFLARLREKNVIGMVAKVYDVVGAYIVYELTDKEINILKFGFASELAETKVAHVLVEELKRKGRKFKKSLEGTFWERESTALFQFLAKEGFKSKVKKNFFVNQHPFSPDGYNFSWNLAENEAFNTD